MGWPMPCFPKEELKTGNGWGQRGTIWRSPSTPSCQGFPTSVMERTKERQESSPPVPWAWGDPTAPYNAALALRHHDICLHPTRRCYCPSRVILVPP